VSHAVNRRAFGDAVFLGAAFIRDELKKVGIAVDVVPLEVGALVDRMTKGEYDALMLKVAAGRTLATRQQLFLQAQKILSDNLPVIYFAVPRVFVATSTRVTGAKPAPVRPPILWNADSIGIAR